MNTPSHLLVYGFALYVVVVAGLAAVALVRGGAPVVRVLLVGSLWLAFTGGLAQSGVLARFDGFPPPVLRLVMLSALVTISICSSSWARNWLEKWSLGGLVAFQAFRLPLELVMHMAAREGVMPGQMTFTGRNFDILTGILAVPLALWLTRRGPQPLLTGLWNLLGLALLFNVVGVAILSVPGPYRLFTEEPANVWIGYAPFVWLPTVLVQLALAGHILVARKLWMERNS